MAIACDALSGSELVSLRKVRDLGALGAAMPARIRRLVRQVIIHAGALDLAAGRDAVPGSSAALRPPEPHWIHRHHRSVESAGLATGVSAQTLPKGGCAVFYG